MDFDYKIEDKVSSKCYQVFGFGGIYKKACKYNANTASIINEEHEW